MLAYPILPSLCLNVAPNGHLAKQWVLRHPFYFEDSILISAVIYLSTVLFAAYVIYKVRKDQ